MWSSHSWRVFPFSSYGMNPRTSKSNPTLIYSLWSISDNLCLFSTIYTSLHPLTRPTLSSKDLESIRTNLEFSTPLGSISFLSIFLITSIHATPARYLCLVFIDTNTNTFLKKKKLIQTQTHATTNISRYTSS